MEIKLRHVGGKIDDVFDDGNVASSRQPQFKRYAHSL